MTDLPFWLRYLVKGTYAVFGIDKFYEDDSFILWALLEPYPKLDVFCKLSRGVQLMVVVYPNTHRYKLELEYHNLTLWKECGCEEPQPLPIGIFQEFVDYLNELVCTAEKMGWTSDEVIK